MNKRMFATVALALLAVCLMAPAAFAQEGGRSSFCLRELGGHHFGLLHGHRLRRVAAYAQAKASVAASEGMARNPGAAGVIQNMLILALVLIESMALYTFAIIFIKVV